jgi:hypothetical protein
MAEPRSITIPITLPSSDEAAALAEFVKRIDSGTVHRFASMTITYSGRSEGDCMWDGILGLQQSLAHAGFAPR